MLILKPVDDLAAYLTNTKPDKVTMRLWVTKPSLCGMADVLSTPRAVPIRRIDCEGTPERFAQPSLCYHMLVAFVKLNLTHSQNTRSNMGADGGGARRAMYGTRTCGGW